MKNFACLMILALISGCSNKIKSSGPKSESIRETEIQYIKNNDFISNALNDYEINSITKKYRKVLKCIKNPVVNIHNPSIIDTIYVFSDSKNKIEIYRALHADLIFTFDVSDSKYELSNNIKPGITKDIFIENMKIKTAINDTVRIGHTEGMQYFTFYFKKAKLKRIEFYTYID